MEDYQYGGFPEDCVFLLPMGDFVYSVSCGDSLGVIGLTLFLFLCSWVGIGVPIKRVFSWIWWRGIKYFSLLCFEDIYWYQLMCVYIWLFGRRLLIDIYMCYSISIIAGPNLLSQGATVKFFVCVWAIIIIYPNVCLSLIFILDFLFCVGFIFIWESSLGIILNR